MIGDKIRSLRTERKDSLRDLGEKVGKTHGYMGKVERGEIRPNTDLLKAIAKVYDMPTSYFFGEVPAELKELDVEWIEVIRDMEQKNLTPAQVRRAAEFIIKIREEEN